MDNNVTNSQNGRMGLMDVLVILAKYNRMIFGITMAVGLIAVIYCYFLPNVYISTARLLPPQNSGSRASALLGAVSQLGLAGDAFGVKNTGDLYVALLKSQRILNDVVERTGLQKAYQKRSVIDAGKQLEKYTTLKNGKEGIITIEVEDTDPRRAALIANAYASSLMSLLQDLSVTEASQRRQFFEQQLKQANDELLRAENAFKNTEVNNGIVELDGQSKALIGAEASLRAQITAKEVQLATLHTYATPENPDLMKAQAELNGLKSQLVQLENGAGKNDKTMLSAANAPETGMEYARRLRDVKYYETISTLMAKQYEMAKVDESNNTYQLQVVDRAIPAEHKAGPKRGMTVVAVMLIAVLFSIVTAFMRDLLHKVLEDPANSQSLQAIRQYLFKKRGELAQRGQLPANAPLFAPEPRNGE